MKTKIGKICFIFTLCVFTVSLIHSGNQQSRRYLSSTKPTFTNPSGGELMAGMPFKIKWSKGQIQSQWGLLLFQNNVRVGIIAGPIPNNVLEQDWTVGETKQKKAGPGTNFFIRLVYEVGDDRYHTDSNTFAIKGVPMTKADPIVINNPKMNTEFQAGEKEHIKWITYGQDIKTEMSISLYDSSGTSFIQNIGRGSNGLFSWDVPDDLHGRYRIKITKAIPSGKGKKALVAKDPFMAESKTFKILPKPYYVTLDAQIYDRHSRRRERNVSRDPKDMQPEDVGLGKIPGLARVGFYGSYASSAEGWYYYGFIFRSRLFFDFSQLQGKLIKEAKLYVQKKESKVLDVNPDPSGLRLFWLTGSWEKPVKCIDTPGYLLFEIGPGKPLLSYDLTEKAKAWLGGKEINYGLLLTNPDEDFSHDTAYIATYYKAWLKITYTAK